MPVPWILLDLSAWLFLEYIALNLFYRGIPVYSSSINVAIDTLAFPRRSAHKAENIARAWRRHGRNPGRCFWRAGCGNTFWQFPSVDARLQTAAVAIGRGGGGRVVVAAGWKPQGLLPRRQG